MMEEVRPVCFVSQIDREPRIIVVSGMKFEPLISRMRRKTTTHRTFWVSAETLACFADEISQFLPYRPTWGRFGQLSGNLCQICVSFELTDFCV
jgi:hypothetical protein